MFDFTDDNENEERAVRRNTLSDGRTKTQLTRTGSVLKIQVKPNPDNDEKKEYPRDLYNSVFKVTGLFAKNFKNYDSFETLSKPQIQSGILFNGNFFVDKMEVNLDGNSEAKKYEFKAITKFALSPKAEDHPDSFFKSMKTAVILAQFFALLPVIGITGPNYKSLQFKWLHWKMLYVFFALGGIFFILMCTISMSFRFGFSYDKSSGLLFFGSEVLASCFLIQIARKWPKINEDFAELEFKFNKYGYPKRTKLKFQIITAIYMAIACVEHALAKYVDVIRNIPCSKHEDDFGSALEAFFTNNYYSVFSLVSYSPWTGILMLYLNFLSTFTWNYTDLFLVLISLSLSQRFKQINEVLLQVQGREMPSSFWRAAREDYNELSVLVKKVDVHTQKLMLLSMADNLYFICLQMLKSLKKRINIYQIIYFFWSFGFLILRTALVCFCAASINDESKEGKNVLYSIPQSSYCTETRRFLTQLTANEVALTGCRFFSVTRGLILTIVGTVITYEIVLMQFNTDTGVEAWPTKDNKTFCATL